MRHGEASIFVEAKRLGDIIVMDQSIGCIVGVFKIAGTCHQMQNRRLPNATPSPQVPITQAMPAAFAMARMSRARLIPPASVRYTLNTSTARASARHHASRTVIQLAPLTTACRPLAPLRSVPQYRRRAPAPRPTADSVSPFAGSNGLRFSGSKPCWDRYGAEPRRADLGKSSLPPAVVKERTEPAGEAAAARAEGENMEISA